MTSTLEILIIEKHPLTLYAYKTGLKNKSLSITGVHNCTEAFTFLKDCRRKNINISTVIIAMNTPIAMYNKVYEESLFIKSLRSYNKKCRLVLISSINSSVHILEAIKSIRPNVFLLKSDIEMNDLMVAIDVATNDGILFSKNIKRVFDSYFLEKFKGISQTDRWILSEMSLGGKIKDISQTLKLSISNIETRKKKLKRLFNAQNDKQLLLKGRQNGFI